MMARRFGAIGALIGMALLTGACSGSIGAKCDSAKEAATNQACGTAKGHDHVAACLAAAGADGQCASASTGDFHYEYLFKQAVETGLAGSYLKGKQGAELGGKALRILQSIANDPHAPVVIKYESQKIAQTMLASGEYDASGHPVAKAGH